MALVPFRVSGAAADQGAEERLFVVSIATAVQRLPQFKQLGTGLGDRLRPVQALLCMLLCHGSIAAGEDKEDSGGRGGILTACAACLPQIAGDSITIRQRPAAAQAMRDQALRSVLQVAYTSRDKTSQLTYTRL